MILELTKLIIALTNLADEATIWISTSPRQQALPLGFPKIEDSAEKKPRGRPAKIKIETEVEAGVLTPETPPIVVISAEEEAESLTQALATAKEFVQKFQKSSPDGLVRARALLTDHFKVTTIPNLNHGQRLEMVQIMKNQIAASEIPVAVA